MIVGKSSNKERARRLRSKKPRVKAKAVKVTKPARSSKIASMTVMLCGKKGATLAELCKMTGWQPHSVRAVISSVMKKKFRLEVVSERVDGERVYRVIVPA